MSYSTGLPFSEETGGFFSFLRPQTFFRRNRWFLLRKSTLDGVVTTKVLLLSELTGKQMKQITDAHGVALKGRHKKDKIICLERLGESERERNDKWEEDRKIKRGYSGSTPAGGGGAGGGDERGEEGGSSDGGGGGDERGDGGGSSAAGGGGDERGDERGGERGDERGGRSGKVRVHTH